MFILYAFGLPNLYFHSTISAKSAIEVYFFTIGQKALRSHGEHPPKQFVAFEYCGKMRIVPKPAEKITDSPRTRA